jgi:hypothetical protein
MVLRRVGVLVMLSVASLPSISTGAVTGWTDVVVRVYDASGAIAGADSSALTYAGKALESASIDVIWQLCATPRACDAPMAPGELAIRIVRPPGPRRYHGPQTLGDALLDTGSGKGVLATIYVDRVEWLANEAGADSRALLGHAIAHELGHLLLASRAHGPVGLMRALWSHEEVRRAQPSDWSFAPGELAVLRRRAEVRQREAHLEWGTR